MTETLNPQYLMISGRRMVVLEEDAFADLLRKADLWVPPLPERDVNGNYPALAALAVLQARDILGARRRLGITQAELARRAGVRPETLNRIEHGKHKPNVATMAKLDRALRGATRKKPKATASRTKAKKG